MKRVYIFIIMLCSFCLLLSACKSAEAESSIFEEIRTAPVVKLESAEQQENEPLFSYSIITSVADMRIVPSDEEFNQEWLYRFTYNPREKVINGHEIVILFGSSALEIDGVTYVPEDGVPYEAILEWAEGKYNYYCK
ncbi:hypothetical protein [uncultured Pseudoflavonifractor sp.]|uniref:hypothetical protein n=1 Tax=uncultured Pseudoflavonifractor sp. TaxID=1221379 RepID=UPI0025EB1ABE|nr:hypothetical protein [uncultured Pseudoflavonifractor sp.]